jgi:hypothetical protein
VKYICLTSYNYNIYDVEEKLGRSAACKAKRIWGNNIKMDLKETVGVCDLIHLSQHGTSGMLF